MKHLRAIQSRAHFTECAHSSTLDQGTLQARIEIEKSQIGLDALIDDPDHQLAPWPITDFSRDNTGLDQHRPGLGNRAAYRSKRGEMSLVFIAHGQMQQRVRRMVDAELGQQPCQGVGQARRRAG